MNKNKTHRVILFIITFTCVGYTVESIVEKWEFWVPPLLIAGLAALWMLHFTQRAEVRYRENLYFAYGALIAFFHGMHETSLFDVASATLLMLVLYSLMDRIRLLNITLIEYVLIMSVQLTLAIRHRSDVFDSLGVARLILQVSIIACVYFIARLAIDNRRDTAEVIRGRDEAIEAYDKDMEDFLSNISHELRTPINVVNGMSTLLIKKGAGAEAEAIREAGIRLSYQIEDIQDYTEIKRRHVVMEEENYMSTSLINDVVASFRRYDNADDLELVVNMDPNVPAMMRGDVRKIHKLFRHLLDNAVKFTRRGGIFLRVYAVPKEYGVNLCIELTDTGSGMSRRGIASAVKGMYQANKKRNRSTGGIGLGLSIVYGLAHAMSGFVKIESERGRGTTVRVTIPQQVVDSSPALHLDHPLDGTVLFHVRSEKYKVPQVRDFYRAMAVNLAKGLNCPLFSAESTGELDRQMKKRKISYIFMGQEEYEDDPAYYDEISRGDVVVAVSARADFHPAPGSRVIVMPKPLYGFPVTKILNEGKDAHNIELADNLGKPVFDGVRALVVDDEPMNLVVATGLFRDYKMVTDTAGSGAEAIEKYRNSEYDVVFMDHMMPEMDGVEAMKHLREIAAEQGKEPVIIALTANAVSGAREMFMREGFDGFIAKPINMTDFEHVMRRVLPGSMVSFEGGGAQ